MKDEAEDASRNSSFRSSFIPRFRNRMAREIDLRKEARETLRSRSKTTGRSRSFT